MDFKSIVVAFTFLYVACAQKQQHKTACQGHKDDNLCSQKIEDMLEAAMEEKTTFTIAEGHQLMTNINKPFNNMIQSNESIPARMIENVEILLQRMIVTLQEGMCDPTMMQNFTRSLINLVGKTLVSSTAVANAWFEMMYQRDEDHHPMQIVTALNQAMKAAKDCIINATREQNRSVTIRVDSDEISVAITKLAENATSDDDEHTAPPIRVDVEQVQRNTIAIAVTYKTLAGLMDLVQKKIENDRSNLNITCMQELCSSRQFKYYVSCLPVFSYTVYSEANAISVPITFTIPIPGQITDETTQLSCEFYDRKSSKWSRYGCQMVNYTDNIVKCSCNHTTNFAVLLIDANVHTLKESQSQCSTFRMLWVVSYICNAFSVVFLTLTVLVFILIMRTLRRRENERLNSHFNLSIAALGLFVTLLLGDVAGKQGTGSCIVLTLATHYFLLAVFAWMTVEGLLLNLYVVRGNIKQTTLGWKKHALGWGVPLVICVIALAVGLAGNNYIYSAENSEVHSQQRQRTCWISNKNGLVWASSGPLLLALAVNAYFFMQVLITVGKLSTQTKRFKPSKKFKTSFHANDPEPRDNLRKKLPVRVFRAFLKLYPVLGLSWLIGWIPGFVVDSEEDICSNHVFLGFTILHTILNGLHGMFIFIVCIATDENVISALRRRFKKNASIQEFRLSNLSGHTGRKKTSALIRSPKQP